ncbi:hypothetical protein QJS10_CPA02g01081 [Acorus calamus]|uniref:Sugar transporter n=1 Tax=Acorus calamus TaxID=4465 RepID=A0AAV9FDW3_ACOCL|nr:hypothetical protein QJS10_CPA02g01083 [Acorus calamus]KAK1324132.1 hypothetical protein QJS10_CPA02g01081 [Acorus calamus]
MKDDEDLLPTMTSPSKPSSTAVGDSSLFGRGRYKFWALGAILLLAFWSMFTGTVTLKWSAGNFNGLSSSDMDAPIHADLDVLEIEEREKVVRHMWDVYAHNPRIRLPRFWQEAFEAAYEDLASNEQTVHDAAVSEIAKMSMRLVELEPPPHQSSTSTREKDSKEDGARGKTKSAVASH